MYSSETVRHTLAELRQRAVVDEANKYVSVSQNIFSPGSVALKEEKPERTHQDAPVTTTAQSQKPQQSRGGEGPRLWCT
jgi:hypothetical protein